MESKSVYYSDLLKEFDKTQDRKNKVNEANKGESPMLKTENLRLAFKSFQLVVVQVICATLGFLFALLFSLCIGGADH